MGGRINDFAGLAKAAAQAQVAPLVALHWRAGLCEPRCCRNVTNATDLSTYQTYSAESQPRAPARRKQPSCPRCTHRRPYQTSRIGRRLARLNSDTHSPSPEIVPKHCHAADIGRRFRPAFRFPQLPGFSHRASGSPQSGRPKRESLPRAAGRQHLQRGGTTLPAFNWATRPQPFVSTRPAANRRRL